MNEKNRNAWNRETYEAWENRFGSAERYAGKIKEDPYKLVSDLFKAEDALKGKKILNLMGSNGNKAVALALLGAQVTVVDFSEGNKSYAMDLAKAAGVHIDYQVADIELIDMKEAYDYVFAEMGILHYFQDLSIFFNICHKVLVDSGICIIRDFHPVSTKLISSRGSTAKVRKHKVDGDYFSDALIEQEVAFSKYLDCGESTSVYLRRWTLGEIVTSMAALGFYIESLIEAPNLSSENFDKGIPKTFAIRGVKSLHLTN